MKKLIILLMAVISYSTITAQNAGLSLKECIDIAVANSEKVANSKIDLTMSDNKIKEMQSKALPHLDAEADYIHNLNIQKIVLENGVIPAFTNPEIPDGEVVAFQLQLNNSITASLNASQVIFDKSLFTSLNSASLYKELANQQLNKSKVDIIEMVSKAYYGVLVSQQQLLFLESNMARVDSVYKETEARFNSGLVRKIDLYRVEVAMNNIKEEKEKASQNLQLSKLLLGYQMNIEKPEELKLSDSLQENMLTEIPVAEVTVNFSDRVEYSILQTQQQINNKNTNIAEGAFYPRLSAFATTGYNPAASDVGDIFQSERYFNYTYVGLRLQIPIFSGFDKKYQLKNEVLKEAKLKNDISLTEKQINLEVQQARINYTKSMESIKIQKRNLNLAQENLNSIKAENAIGVANNIEVVSAEDDFRQAQNSYYNALYQALIVKVDFEKASGKLK